jgi:hypothetical protein
MQWCTVRVVPNPTFKRELDTDSTSESDTNYLLFLHTGTGTNDLKDPFMVFVKAKRPVPDLQQCINV